jgi:hypothetical protein
MHEPANSGDCMGQGERMLIMPTEQQLYLDKLRTTEEGVSSSWVDYWIHYSNMTTWQFWVNTLFLLIPLVMLWFFIDRKRVFMIGFYGFNIHVWLTYIDLFGSRNGFWEYPHKTIPFTPTNFSLDVSLVPVACMLLLQWILNHNKNYYLYATLISAIFAFCLKPIMYALGLFQMYKGVNYFKLFLCYLVIMLLSKWIVNIFLHLQNKEGAGEMNVNLILHKREKAK